MPGPTDPRRDPPTAGARGENEASEASRIERHAAPADSWGRHLGHIWAQQLLEPALRPDGTVVEIGPGFSAKIGFGLAEVGFRGTVILVEPNGPARRWARRHYRRLLPMARLGTSCRAVPDAAELPIAGPIDALVANHVLDDLLLNRYLAGLERDRIFGEMRSAVGCSDRFTQIWRQLRGAPETLRELADRVVEDLTDYVAVLRPARLIVNDYPSWPHRDSGLGFIHDVSRRMLECLEQRLAGSVKLSSQPRSDGAVAVRWLVAHSDGPSKAARVP
jgi:hypothetical protein